MSCIRVGQTGQLRSWPIYVWNAFHKQNKLFPWHVWSHRVPERHLVDWLKVTGQCCGGSMLLPTFEAGNQTHPQWAKLRLVSQPAQAMEKVCIVSNKLYLSLDSPLPPKSVMRPSAVRAMANVIVGPLPCVSEKERERYAVQICHTPFKFENGHCQRK